MEAVVLIYLGFYKKDKYPEEMYYLYDYVVK